MFRENRTRLMTRMALYESAQGREELKIAAYYRKDYVSMHVLGTLIWTTLGYFLLGAVLVFGYMDLLLGSATLARVIILGAIAVGGYVLVLILAGVLASRYYRGKYNEAKKNVRKYYRDLHRLEKMYEKRREA